jgi:hypothetical protein
VTRAPPHRGATVEGGGVDVELGVRVIEMRWQP